MDFFLEQNWVFNVEEKVVVWVLFQENSEESTGLSKKS